MPKKYFPIGSEENGMKIFQKLFGDPLKRTRGAAVGPWDEVLGKCDLVMARDEIAEMHKLLNAEGGRAGGTYYFKNEYVAAWETFRDNPNIDTARELLEIAPPLLEYFEMCSPGTSFYSTHRFLKERGL